MQNRLLSPVVGLLSVVIMNLIFSPALPSPVRADEGVAFEMREVSVFDNPQTRDLVRGQYAQCETEPAAEVKAYPAFKSSKPLYGVIKFDHNYLDPESGIEYHFVLDESGGTAPAEEPTLLKTLSRALRDGGDTQTETKNTYDRLYFDLNRDLDLTNDPVLTPAADPPAAAIPTWSAKQKVVFEDLSIPLDFGPDVGSRPFAVLPRLIISEHEGTEYPTLYFIAKQARQGRIRIGSREYDAVMGQQYLVTGRFDRASTTLLLSPVGGPVEREWWWGADQLSAMRHVDGRYFTTATSALGDRLIVRPYDGPFGLLQMGAGGRELDKLSISGSLRSEETAVAVGQISPVSSRPDAAREFRLPVGDYMASYLTFEFGPLRIGVSDNYHSDGKPRDMERTRRNSIKIRSEKPFVLDFGNDPEVMFASPAKEQTFRPGDEVSVMAVLTDPVLDIMIRRLDDTSRTQKEETNLPGGTTRTIERQLSLDPMVTITDSAGKVVSKGKMPFG